MGSHADIPPADAILCEECGYNLNGASGRCPECGAALERSTASGRTVTDWEAAPSPVSWLHSRHAALWHPSRFAQTMMARAPRGRSFVFALLEFSITAAWLVMAAVQHLGVLSGRGVAMPPSFLEAADSWPLLLLAWLLTCAGLLGLMWVTAWLTAWEAAYRGLRLPQSAAERGLHYHSVHYTTAAMTGVLLIIALRMVHGPGLTHTVYTWVLCGYVLLAAGYVFFTYWAFMRRLLYANR
jgi:hypothetical protein